MAAPALPEAGAEKHSAADPQEDCVALEQEANCCSKFLFSWLDAIVVLGYKRPLQHTDLGHLHYDTDKAGWLADQLEQRIARARAEGGNMWRVLRETRTHVMLWALFCKILGDTIGYVPFIGLDFVSRYLEVSACRVGLGPLHMLARAGWATALSLT